MKRQINQCADELFEFKSRVGHYSVRNIRNINKRDETARKTRRLLREARYTISRQNRSLKEANVSIKQKENDIN